MSKIIIFGNSGSGKSTLARHLSETNDLAYLDLDTLAWKATFPPERQKIELSWDKIANFISINKSWVIEGCYTDLLELIKDESTEIVFMNLPIDLCVSNAKARPWEPHKYPSKQAQDENLYMLINWISQYSERKDVFSYDAHIKFYNEYKGKKQMFTRNETHT